MRRRIVALLLGCLVAAPGCRGGTRGSSARADGPAGGDVPGEAEAAHEAEIAPAVRDGPALSFARVAVIGASVSAGFGVLGITEVLDPAIREPHAMGDFAELLLFQDPFVLGGRQIDRAVAFEPTVVFALDFLFWYAYGYGWTLAERERSLDAGLRALERLRVPVLVGDLPDMTGAAEWMLAPEQIPPRPELDALNLRLRRWAEGRPDVLVVPLGQWTAPLRGAAPVSVDEAHLAVDPHELMSPDGLHPNTAGLRYLLRKTLAEILERFPGTPADAVALPAPLE